MRRIWIGLAAAGLVAAQPLAAQDKGSDTAATHTDKSSEPDVAGMMKTLFKVEPLTAEQRARLPQAEAVIARMMPPGTLQQMLGGMFDKFLGPIMAMGGEASSADVARELGIEDEDLALKDAEVARIAAILDPARKQRRELEAAAFQHAMTTAMTAMEPSMRKGMAEAYAATFTSGELSDIDAFFATSSGTSFARKSYALATDPRILASAMEGLPSMMGQMKAMEEEAKAATSKLPARRGYGDLTPAERAEIAKLTGLKQGALREGMERAAAERAELEAAKDKGGFEGAEEEVD